MMRTLIALLLSLLLEATSAYVVTPRYRSCSPSSYLSTTRSRRTLGSSSFSSEENDDKDDSMDTTTATTTTVATKSKAAEILVNGAITDGFERVQRYYETFVWKRRFAASPSGDEKPVVDSKDHADAVGLSSPEYKINYRVEGPVKGQPLLLVHGFGANVNHFRYNIPAMVDQGFRVYAIDLLGFGASEKPPGEDYCFELYTALLEDFCNFALSSDDNDGPQKKWIVAGNSIGGLCCLGLARNVPDQVMGVVLFNCAGGLTSFRYEDVPLWARPILFFVQKIVLGPIFGPSFFDSFKTRENVQAILTQQVYTAKPARVDEELLEIILAPGNDQGATQVFLKTFAGPPGPTPETILPLVKCPILAIWGEDDRWTPVDTGARPGRSYAQHVTAAAPFTLEVIPRAGHCPHDEFPDEVHQALFPWIAKLTQSTQ